MFENEDFDFIFLFSRVLIYIIRFILINYVLFIINQISKKYYIHSLILFRLTFDVYLSVFKATIPLKAIQQSF